MLVLRNSLSLGKDMKLNKIKLVVSYLNSNTFENLLVLKVNLPSASYMEEDSLEWFPLWLNGCKGLTDKETTGGGNIVLDGGVGKELYIASFHLWHFFLQSLLVEVAVEINFRDLGELLLDLWEGLLSDLLDKFTLDEWLKT